MLELATLAQQGEQTAVVFIVQRADAHTLRPQWETDPEFGEALALAQQTGVAVYAYTCRLTTKVVQLLTEIPVVLERE